MKLNSTIILFSIILIFRTLISLSSNNWFGRWIGLEINLIVFIPLIYSKLNYYSSECSIKYFIIQRIRSSILLLSIIFISLKLFCNIFILILVCRLLIKLGIAPFHIWIPRVIEGISWINCIILSTWQKIAILILLRYLIDNFIILFPVIIRLMVGSIGGINQRSLKKLIAYSSINNMAWIIIGITIRLSLWLNYFLIYSFIISGLIIIISNMKFNYLSQFYFNSYVSLNKYFILIIIFSLGGLPPLFGFLPKWIIIQSIILSSNYFIRLIIILTSLLTLFYYIQILTKMILLNSIRLKWIKFTFNDSKLISLICFFNIFGFIIIILFKSFY